MTTTYRRRWKFSDLGTPASLVARNTAGVTLVRKDGPTLTERISQAAYRVNWAATDEQRSKALAELNTAIADALNAGCMVDITTNRDTLRANSYKHCITFRVRRPGEREDIPPARVFINRMSRTQHDALLPAIRQMFVGDAASNAISNAGGEVIA